MIDVFFQDGKEIVLELVEALRGGFHNYYARL